MTVRDFNGSSDYIDLGIINVVNDFTWAIVLKRESNGTWDAIVTHQLADDTFCVSVALTDTNHSQYAMKSTIATTGNQTTASGSNPFTVTLSDGWVILVHSYSNAGGGTLIQSVFKGGVWTHCTTTGFTLIAKSQAGGKIRVGRYENTDNFDGKIAAMALWQTVALTPTQIAALSAGSIAAWAANAAGAPTEHWELNQAVASGVEGANNVSDQVAISGTTAVAGDDPGPTIYTFAAGVNDKSGAALLHGGGAIVPIKQKNAIATH